MLFSVCSSVFSVVLMVWILITGLFLCFLSSRVRSVLILRPCLVFWWVLCIVVFILCAFGSRWPMSCLKEVLMDEFICLFDDSDVLFELCVDLCRVVEVVPFVFDSLLGAECLDVVI